MDIEKIDSKEALRLKRMSNLRQFKPKDNPASKLNVIPDDLVAIVPSHVKDLLNQVEFMIYCNDIKGWIKDHPEWILKEDIDDINGIAMEKVIQFKLYSEKRDKKSADIDKELTSSLNREQTRRSNLDAKRASRIIENKSNTTNINFIKIASDVDVNRIRKIRDINRAEIEADEALFPIRKIEELEKVNM